MALATDALIKKAITTTTNFNALIPQLWAAQLEKNLRIRAVLQQSLVENTDLMVPNAGNTVYIPILPDLTGTLDLLTEGTDMTDIAMNNASSVAYTPVEYGKSVGVTRKTLDRIKYDGVAAIIDRLSYLTSRTIETQIAALYNASVPGTANKMTDLYVGDQTGANITTASTITATSVMTDELILRGVMTLANNNNIPFEDGYYRLYISPAQYKAMMLDSNIRTDLHFGAPDKVFRGEVGAIHNCRVIVTNSVPTALEGASSNVTVYKALLVAPRWAAVAWKRRPQVVVDPTLYDMGRRRRFGVVGDWDIELLHAERGVVLTSA